MSRFCFSMLLCVAATAARAQTEAEPSDASASVGFGTPTAAPEPAPTSAAATLPPLKPSSASGLPDAPKQLPAPRMVSASAMPLVTHPANGMSPPAWSAVVEAAHTEKVTSCCSFEACRPQLFDNLSFFVGLDGYKEPADLGFNANFGYRLAVNWGMPLLESAGLGLQVGAAFNDAQSALPLLPLINGTGEHWQSFTTVGLFQRLPSGWNWGFAWDNRFDDYYDRYDTMQLRGQIGAPLGGNDEVGTWGAVRLDDARVALTGVAFTLRPLNQIDFYWRHVWNNEAATRLWVGLTEDHARSLVGSIGTVQHPVCFGGDFQVPLSDSLALFGEAQFVTPNDSGTVCATLGVVWYPGAARRAARSQFAPLLPVANTASMPLDLRR